MGVSRKLRSVECGQYEATVRVERRFNADLERGLRELRQIAQVSVCMCTVGYYPSCVLLVVHLKHGSWLLVRAVGPGLVQRRLAVPELWRHRLSPPPGWGRKGEN